MKSTVVLAVGGGTWYFGYGVLSALGFYRVMVAVTLGLLGEPMSD